jgi:hypothetical protein
MAESLAELRDLARSTFEAARDALVRIEDAAQAEERPALLALARAYAGLLGPLRDYLAGAQQGRPMPRQLARRLGEHIAAMAPQAEEIGSLSLHPDVAELTRLVDAAEAAAGS